MKQVNIARKRGARLLKVEVQRGAGELYLDLFCRIASVSSFIM
jgi:hypothetical protein